MIWSQWISQNKKRYSEQQIIRAIQKHEAGSKVEDLCHEMCITLWNIYNWRSKYDGLEMNKAKWLKNLETEKNRLKKMLTDKILKVEAIKDAL